MIPLSRCIFLFFTVILCLPNFSQAQQNLLDYGNSLKFARYLNTTKQYTFAAEEYERLNFVYPNDSSVIFGLVQTYRLNHQCEKFESSLELLSINERVFKYPIYTKEYLRFALDCKLKDPMYFSLVSLLSPEEKVFYTASYFLVNRQYDSLFDYNKKENELLSRAHPDLFNLTKSFERQKYKKPALAFLMSSIIPGSGKAYSKRWGDAIVSFLFVGTNTYASYRAFHKKGIKSANGWIFGGLAFSFYSANLWGSVKAVKKYNTNLKETFQNNAENIIHNSY